MISINEILKSNNLVAKRYEKNGKAIILDTNNGKYVVKEKINSDIIDYLNSRSFNYYPKIIDSNDKYELLNYINEVDMPLEQKMLDMIDLVALLHNKTTYYKEVDEDEFKKTYEDISNNIIHLQSYYTDIITYIESKVIMSPPEYILARNISKIFSALNYCHEEINKWYDIVKEKNRVRYAIIHNNLDLSHFIKNDYPYLISWNKSKIDIPIFDIYKLYKKHGFEYDFESILKKYEKNYKLLEEEKRLLFVLISMPDKIEFDKSNYELTKEISNQIDMLYKTDMLISTYKK